MRRGASARHLLPGWRAEPVCHFSSNTRSSIGRVIFTLSPSTSTTASSPVVEWPVDKMKNSGLIRERWEASHGAVPEM